MVWSIKQYKGMRYRYVPHVAESYKPQAK
jgi:hypothetical protein